MSEQVQVRVFPGGKCSVLIPLAAIAITIVGWYAIAHFIQTLWIVRNR